jgi:hypothetical protein
VRDLGYYLVRMLNNKTQEVRNQCIEVHLQRVVEARLLHPNSQVLMCSGVYITKNARTIHLVYIYTARQLFWLHTRPFLNYFLKVLYQNPQYSTQSAMYMDALLQIVF